VKALLDTIEKPRELFSLHKNKADTPADPAAHGSHAHAHHAAPSGSPAKKAPKKKASLVTYLNVHAGVSIGVMAGMDVGAKDRFEVRLFCYKYSPCSSAFFVPFFCIW
jgi:hypothetical protein